MKTCADLRERGWALARERESRIGSPARIESGGLGASLVEYARAWEAEVAALTRELEVEKAADQHLGGYRALGAKCAELEERAEKAEATVNDLTEKLRVAEDKLARPLWHIPSDDMPEMPTVFEIAPHGSTLQFKFVFLDDYDALREWAMRQMKGKA